eukprot:CAMPEP_0114556306 /NCGR_PEP_ID=MMETSP0114-20121206/9224_1 /TAXON_ID=31324 /ORGANISM="Goniomonas sp, Strain m" /LENGTH=103 /DNA_ID=CAMNT_0001741513 /DNA_START=1 /DNA_END=312 /DNA_ORIENTATION=+
MAAVKKMEEEVARLTREREALRVESSKAEAAKRQQGKLADQAIRDCMQMAIASERAEREEKEAEEDAAEEEREEKKWREAQEKKKLKAQEEQMQEFDDLDALD